MRTKNSRALVRAATSALAVGGLLLPALPAEASGFAAARFGGPRGNPTESNPTALYYNPGGLGMAPGFRLLVDYTLAVRSASYVRPPEAIGRPAQNPSDFTPEQIAANSGEATLLNAISSPMLGMSYGFHDMGVPLTIAAGFFAPFGGQAVWDRTTPVEGFPGSGDGAQRWYSIDGTIRTLAFSFGASYLIEPARLSIGASANYYSHTVQTLRARTSAGVDDLRTEGRSYIDASGSDLGFGVGALWEAIEGKLWIGASYQSRPNIDGRQALEGTLRNIFAEGDESQSNIVFTQKLPDIYRLGFRYRPHTDWEVRLFGDYTRWSALNQQCVIEQNVLGDNEPFSFCRLNENGSLVDPASNVTLAIPRGWNDAFGVRVGGSYFVSDRLELQLDTGYDGNAIPDERLEPALMDMGKMSLGAGVVYGFTDWFSLAVNATNIFYFERDTTGARTANTLQQPSTQPSSEGIYNQNIFLLNTGLYFSF